MVMCENHIQLRGLIACGSSLKLSLSLKIQLLRKANGAKYSMIGVLIATP